MAPKKLDIAEWVGSLRQTAALCLNVVARADSLTHTCA